MVFLFLIGWFKNNSQIDRSDYKLSVVIAVRNEEKNILRLIKNLKSQDYDNNLYDIIIIDDHSEDNSWKILVEQASLWPNLIVLKQDSQLSGKKMAILKGVPYWKMVFKHVLPNALLPAINVVALTIAWLLGGVVVTEVVFNYPGLGRLVIESISNRDLPVVQALGIILASIYVSINFIADLLTLMLNPRLKTLQTRK